MAPIQLSRADWVEAMKLALVGNLLAVAEPNGSVTDDPNDFVTRYAYDQIDQLVAEIESSLQQLGRAEVSSRVVGDMAIAGLKKLDHIAYIRFAIVYLQMDDLRQIRDEINTLLEA